MYAVTAGSPEASPPAAYAANSSDSSSGIDQPSSRMWWQVTRSLWRSAPVPTRVKRISGGRPTSNGSVRSRSVSASRSSGRSTSRQGTGTARGISCTGCPFLR